MLPERRGRRSLTPRPVREAVDRFYRELEQGGDLHWDALARASARPSARRSARFIGAEPDEIAFVPNTSTGINLIADLLERRRPGAVGRARVPDGHAALDPPRRAGALRDGGRGRAAARVLRGRPGAARRDASRSATSSSRTAAARISTPSARSRPAGTSWCARSQSLGAFPVDVRRSGIDALASAGHKWLVRRLRRGPLLREPRAPRRRARRGPSGWLSGDDPYAFDNRGLRLLPSNARTELGCPPFGPIFALGAAVDYLSGIGIAAIAERVLDAQHVPHHAPGARVVRGALAGRRAPLRARRSCACPSPARAARFLRERGVLRDREARGRPHLDALLQRRARGRRLRRGARGVSAKRSFRA